MLGLKLALAGQLLLVSAGGGLECPEQKSARVDVRWRSNPVQYDFTRSINGLNGADIDTVSPYGSEVVSDVGGLMSGNIRYESNIQISSIRYSAGRMTCLWVDKVMVDVTIDPVIYVASEYGQGTCKHNAILEHEHKHVALDRQIVRENLDKIRQVTAEAVQKVGVVGPKPDSEAENFKVKMSGYIQTALKAQVDAMFAERMSRQRALDSAAEYSYVHNRCL